MGITPLTFTGTSQYASDFQSILNRAVGIASIPLQRLQNQDQTDLTQKTQLGTLQSAVASLASAVKALGTVAGGQAISATSSDNSVVTVTATGATSSAAYTVNSVTSLAAAASETSVGGYADSSATPVSSGGTLNLVLGGHTYPVNLTPQTNNLVGLQNAINKLNVGVTASILTTGGASGNYLSLTANSSGATTLQLFDGPVSSNVNLLTSNNQGTDAVFELNKLSITRSQNTINDLVSGATISLQGKSSTPVSLTLASDPTQLASGIQNFVAAYDSVVSQIKAQSGQGGGALVGDSVIQQVQSALRQLTGYQGSGSVRYLSDLGVTLGTDGTASFNQSTFSGLSSSQVASAFQFFGTNTTGFGGLSQSLSAISDPISGTIAAEQNALTAGDQKLQAQITATTAQINATQQTLLQQLARADTLISSLQSQQNTLNASLTSLSYVTYGKLTTTA